MSEETRDAIEVIAGVPLVVVIPALVELLKRQGLPTAWAGVAAMIVATGLLVLGDVALGLSADVDWAVQGATWVLRGMVYGLAAAGFYSQRDVLLPKTDGTTPAS